MLCIKSTYPAAACGHLLLPPRARPNSGSHAEADRTLSMLIGPTSTLGRCASRLSSNFTLYVVLLVALPATGASSDPSPLLALLHLVMTSSSSSLPLLLLLLLLLLPNDCAHSA